MGLVTQGQVPGFKRMMVFCDGENLTMCYQAMKNKGRVPEGRVVHQNDTFLWHPMMIPLIAQNEIWRVTYYTYVQGDEQELNRVTKELKSFSFENHGASALPNNLKPCVYKKPKGSHGKGVDIKMTVEILSNVYKNNVDAVLLISGDGDYVPIIKEVIRQGKIAYVASFSEGLNRNLLNYADKYFSLDEVFFKPNEG